MEKAIVILLLASLPWRGLSILVHRFATEDIPVGYTLDEENVLESITLAPGNGQATLCSLLCKSSRPCLGFVVQDGSCKIYVKLSTVADASVRN